MGASPTVVLQDQEIEEIRSATGFRPKQIHRLFNRFKHLDKQDIGYLSRDDLLSIPEVNINPLGERLVDVMIEDYGENDSVNFKQFASILAQFHWQILNERLYDRNHDGKIDKQELLAVLKMMVGGNIDDKSLNDVAENAIRELDDSNNGFITYDKFCESLDKVDLDTKMSMHFMN